MQTLQVRPPAPAAERSDFPISLQDLAQALEHSDEGFALTDPEGNYVYINQAHLRMYGYQRPEELLGRSWRTLYADDWVRHFTDAVLPIIPRDKVWRGQVVGRRRDGSSFLASVTLTLLPDGKITCNCRDESARPAHPGAPGLGASTALRTLGEQLIAGLPARWRRPLEQLSGYSSFLLEELQKDQTPTPEALRAGLEEIDAAGRRLSEQIKRLDLVAQLAARDEWAEAPGPQDPGKDWTGRLAAACRACAAQAGREGDLTVTLTADQLAIDYRPLECLVSELLRNALQSSRAGAAVCIKGEPEGRDYLIRVCDEGVGWPGDGWPSAGDHTLGQPTAGGFGLAVVHYILQRAGGRLTRDEEASCSTCLVLHLPRGG